MSFHMVQMMGWNERLGGLRESWSQNFYHGPQMSYNVRLIVLFSIIP